jgi:hypothetical protein
MVLGKLHTHIGLWVCHGIVPHPQKITKRSLSLSTFPFTATPACPTLPTPPTSHAAAEPSTHERTPRPNHTNNRSPPPGSRLIPATRRAAPRSTGQGLASSPAAAFRDVKMGSVWWFRSSRLGLEREPTGGSAQLESCFRPFWDEGLPPLCFHSFWVCAPKHSLDKCKCGLVFNHCLSVP